MSAGVTRPYTARVRWLSVVAMVSMSVPAAAPAGGGRSELVEELLPRVVKVMGLPAPRTVRVKQVSRREAEALLRREVASDGERLARLGEALVTIGLLPAGTRLEALAPEFNRQNVSGFYDLHEHTLYLLEDQPDDAQRPIVAHELAHAVQDASLGVDAALAGRRGSEDAVLALTATLEGQAQATAALVMDGWLRDQHVAVEGMAGLLSDAAARSAADAADHAPVPWLGLQLRFPYVAGRALIEALATRDDPVARRLLARPPASTAQVMAPALWTRAEAPLEGALHLDRLIPGATASIATTLGRANLELLGEGLGEGWRGDRLEAVRAGGKAVVVWVVAFDSPKQTERLAAALTGRGAVVRQGALVALLCGVPARQDAAVRAASLTAFGVRP